MRTVDLLSASDDELLSEFERQATTTVLAVAPIQTELQRRATTRLISATEALAGHTGRIEAQAARLATATEQLARSSDRVERFTKALLVLTVLLLVAAIPPALSSFATWLRSSVPASGGVVAPRRENAAQSFGLKKTHHATNAPVDSMPDSKFLISVISAVIAAVSFVVAALAYRLNRRNAINARRPAVVFEWDDGDGWKVRNVGNGPALNVRIAVRGRSTAWTQFVRIPALRAGSDFTLTWIGKLNAWMLGAEYSDFAGEHYSSISQHDMNVFAQGAAVLSYDKPDHDYVIGRDELRHWNAPDLSREESLT